MRVLAIVSLLFVCSAPGFAGGPGGSRPSVATVTKVLKNVSRKPEGGTWEGAHKGDLLQSGDMLKTGDSSFAIVKFTDNSLVRIREKSELTVTGTILDRALSKSVNIGTGAVGFKIPRQQGGEEFRFTSPTSVASIRGTSGLFISADSTDTLTVLEGTILYGSRSSSSFVDVGPGFTAVSSPDGTVARAPSTPEQRSDAEDAVRTGDQQKSFEFELRSGSGKSKKLRIDFKE
jgi:hypothetical protein